MSERPPVRKRVIKHEGYPMHRLMSLLLMLLCSISTASARPADRPVRVAIARLTHGHVGGLLGRRAIGDVEIVGIYEPDRAVAARYVRDYHLDPALVHDRLAPMLDLIKPEAVLAFGSVAEHREVVEAAAPRRIHVMVEKPLSFDAAEAAAMAALARRHGIQLLTNYETSWYPSRTALGRALAAGSVGAIRKVVFRDGHYGPKEIGVQPEFLSWLVDPKANGGGAMVDFGCYGADLMTWLMQGRAPISVTAVTQRLKRDPVYARVDDEATIVLSYPAATAVLQASWNWPDHRKDIQLFGETGVLSTPDGKTLVLRRRGETADRTLDMPVPAFTDPFAFLAAVVRGRVEVAEADPSSLDNALIVARILDAARRSAATGRTVVLDQD
ncbi:Gfo/Idh/MocA family oxidoreductase [Sphingomonas yunnanensis]|uniref:Gfo/Idh/MocA family protein n=1 Tax=Sphingomonas yunnanensis TaxID=310400 RepID=UPI001CA64EBD|nr:Gfo/Idh/MocA family oxidoreductase [Sphingomonas yunnanensis]MBY9063429.1 Gfo/Idh/MocA family oxidoreductase [Sphingomonas yunnanensis]